MSFIQVTTEDGLKRNIALRKTMQSKDQASFVDSFSFVSLQSDEKSNKLSYNNILRQNSGFGKSVFSPPNRNHPQLQLPVNPNANSNSKFKESEKRRAEENLE